MEFLWWLSGKEFACQGRRCRRLRFDPWVRRIPPKETWQPTPVIMPGKSHGQRSLAGCSPWGCKEWHTIEQLTLTYLVLNELLVSRFNIKNSHLTMMGQYSKFLKEVGNQTDTTERKEFIFSQLNRNTF